MKKIALGMSGGVDSSLCAHLLVEQGYEVTGVYLECWRAPGCRSEEDRADALKVALSLGIPFQVLDFKDTYKNKVVEYFFEQYQAGLTPNPDVLCNKEIKFGLFYDWALSHGFDAVATGHYARITQETETHIPHLAIPTDTHKDQTYFLYLLKQEQLAHIIFPLSELTKPQVRIEAEKRGLHVADKKDSVGICFIGDINVHNFLEERLGTNPGEVIDTRGNVIGKHQGLWFYTVGQRHGFEINARTLVRESDGREIEKDNIPPFYVIKKLAATNQLLVGFGAETYMDQFSVAAIHWIGAPPALRAKDDQGREEKLLVRIRHTGKLIPCTLHKTITDTNEELLIIQLEEAIQGIAEGQSAVFYTQKEGIVLCLGGGIISA
ncbi:tRNA 2-thiouridine(34) synthase MnmA [Candidatus Woesebacteria bacterium]|nr:tRNA 2-thiouridine(34) synthase MnmA [Candidatus Woesebacteria bacterium]